MRATACDCSSLSAPRASSSLAACTTTSPIVSNHRTLPREFEWLRCPRLSSDCCCRYVGGRRARSAGLGEGNVALPRERGLRQWMAIAFLPQATAALPRRSTASQFRLPHPPRRQRFDVRRRRQFLQSTSPAPVQLPSQKRRRPQGSGRAHLAQSSGTRLAHPERRHPRPPDCTVDILRGLAATAAHIEGLGKGCAHRALLRRASAGDRKSTRSTLRRDESKRHAAGPACTEPSPRLVARTARIPRGPELWRQLRVSRLARTYPRDPRQSFRSEFQRSIALFV